MDAIDIETQFQNIMEKMLTAVPNCKGIVMHVEAPTQNISWTGATGWADGATQRKLLPNDPALIASITKTYTSAAVLRLVEDGKIGLYQPIERLINEKSRELLVEIGYDLKHITVAHLNSQTSGIADFTNTDTYQHKSVNRPGYEWTRDEQIALALTLPPVAIAGKQFGYSETNNSLLTEIIERQTGLPFYEAMRELLDYKKLGLSDTWFNWLEQAPNHLTPLAHQFATGYKVDSYSLHPTFDLFGGGGIASTAKDVALFTQALFNGELFANPKTKDLLYETIRTADGKENHYYMGIAKTQLGKLECYGHGGFWGTTTQYFPSLNASVAIFLMERDEWENYRIILAQVAGLLEEECVFNQNE